MNQTNTRLRVLRGAFLVTILLLILQYIFGMLVNLYVQFPNTLTNGNAWGWSFTNSVFTQIHVYLGTLLLAFSLVTLILSLIVRSAPSVIASLIGFAMTIFAFIAGIWFLTYGQQSASSLWMSLGFLGALVAYGVGYYLVRPVRQKETRQVS